ncbi:hypothetical protein TRIP_C20462 [Candidatus Zixiibacteriota bacterium]|nr:hypothetical protein TRIP_C20462 [candidate division Zixibacteria bacterium]
MKKYILTFVILIIASAAMAGKYKIDRLINVAPANWIPKNGPVKFSPDGSQVAFFYRGYLYISDTLGLEHQASLDSTIYPVRYEWLSNDEIILQRQILRNTTAVRRLCVINIDSGEERTILEDVQPVYYGASGDAGSFIGPFLTVEGNPCYILDQPDVFDIIIPTSTFGGRGKSLAEADNHILQWGADGLYLVRADQGDSTRLTRKPYPRISLHPAISYDEAYILMGGLLEHLADSSYMILDTLVKDNPPTALGCGILYGSFSPNSSEILFQDGCPDDQDYLDNHIETYDYDAKLLVSLDALVNLSNCVGPSYSPDGHMISFICNDTAYIAYRVLYK